MGILYAFDFDHTIIHDNSDTAVWKLTPTPLPQEVKDVFDGRNWTQMMNKVFEFLHQQGVKVEDVEGFAKGLEPTPGMASLLVDIHRKIKDDKDGSQLIIISDANDVFISSFMKGIGVEPQAVITNKAQISEEGRLVLTPYEEQKDCVICPKNLCKGAAIQKYIEQNGHPFASIVYVGDGHNDACPGMKLGPCDALFVRSGYGLEKILKRGSTKGMNGQEIKVQIQAKVHFWENAQVIRNEVFKN